MREIITPSSYADNVNIITAAGGTITSRFEQAIDRWAAYSELDNQAQANLNAAILDTDTTAEELATLHALAVVEASPNPVNNATVKNAAGAHILHALRAEYATVAAANYETMRDKFNTAADKYRATVAITDPDAKPEQLMSASAKIRTAWADVPMIALELDALLSVLATAATLAGKAAEQTKHHIGLTTNTDGLHRRRVWEAWENNTSRAGRWQALTTLGATIEAPTLDDYTPYREPAPMETRHVRAGIGVRNEQFDPEDDNYEAEEAPRKAGRINIH